MTKKPTQESPKMDIKTLMDNSEKLTAEKTLDTKV